MITPGMIKQKKYIIGGDFVKGDFVVMMVRGGVTN
tara:strand:+ start:718 stop:822 length:105 start_codon:yes stop_codon:yes gene_type:complete